MSDDTLQRIKLALAGKDNIDIGHFQWINLDMIKDEVGDQWIDVRKKIYNVAADFIEKRLDKKDALLRCRGGFIVVYANLAGEAAIAQTASLAESVNRFFLGDRALRHLEISAKTTTLDIAVLGDFLKRSALNDPAREAARAKTPSEAKRSIAPENLAWRAIRTIKPGHTEVIVRDRRRSDSDPVGRPAADPQEDVLPKPDKSGAPVGIDATSEMQHLASLRFEVPAAEWDDIIFKPCWDVKFNHVTASFCLPRRVHKGATLYGIETLLGNREPAILHSMDHAVAVTAQRGFLKQYSAGRKCAVVIPVQYSTVIGTQDRIRYFSILQNVPQKARKYFYLRVDNIPEGAPIGQMEELFRSMRIFGSNLLAKIPPGTTQLDRFDNCSIAIYSTSLEQNWARTGLPDHIMRKLTDQAVSIQRKSKRGALTRVDTLDELNFGIDAGYEIFTGAVIGGDRILPSPLIAMRRDDLAKAARSSA